jgi:WD40-like Beta Propeller Repeat
MASSDGASAFVPPPHPARTRIAATESGRYLTVSSLKATPALAYSFSFCAGRYKSANLVAMPKVTTALTALVASVCLLGLPALPASAQLKTQGAKAPKLLLEGWPNENEGAIYVANADGTNLKRITPFSAQTPAWSPDGRRIAFEGAFGPCPPCNLFMYTSARDGTKAQEARPWRLAAMGAIREKADLRARSRPDWDHQRGWQRQEDHPARGRGRATPVVA